MSGRTQKLALLLGDRDLATELVQAGLDTPRKIRAAKPADVKKAVGKEKADRVLKRFEKVKAVTKGDLLIDTDKVDEVLTRFRKGKG